MANLSEHDWQTLERLADQVIPADDFPSASDAGFRQFLEQNWLDVIGAQSDRLQSLLRDQRLEDHPWFVNAVAESYYANSENGGNYRNASFLMLGFEYKPALDIPFEMAHHDNPAIDALQPHYRAGQPVRRRCVIAREQRWIQSGTDGDGSCRAGCGRLDRATAKSLISTQTTPS